MRTVLALAGFRPMKSDGVREKKVRSKETYSVALNHFLKTTDPAKHRFSLT